MPGNSIRFPAALISADGAELPCSPLRISFGIACKKKIFIGGAAPKMRLTKRFSLNALAVLQENRAAGAGNRR